MSAVTDSANLRQVRARQRRFSTVVGGLTLVLIGACLNRCSGVGNEERYTELARRVWGVLTEEAGEGG